MPAVVACPKCKKKYKLPDNMLGKSVKCTQCQTQFGAPAPKTSVNDPQKQAAMQAAKAARARQAQDLKALGVEGTIERPADIFSDSAMTGTPDPLANHIVQDPGFGDGSELTLAPQKVERPDDVNASMFSNPALSQGQVKKKSKADSLLPTKGKKTKREMHPAVKDSINKATMTLLIIGALIAMLFGFFYISAYDDAMAGLKSANNFAAAAGGEQMGEAEMEEIAMEEATGRRIGAAIGIGIGIFFMCLGGGVQLFPITCSLLSLVIYLIFEILFTLATLDFLSFVGWIRRIVICGALGKAFMDALNARYYNQMMEQRRLSGKID